MCGIVAYVGKNKSREYVLEGLSRLEYRGYDASGFGCLDATTQELVHFKTCGGVEQLIKVVQQAEVDGHIGIGHIRWSSHGLASDLANAHPHSDCTQKISLVHNGVIENHYELRRLLIQEGHQFKSQTDTEVLVHLLEGLLSSHSAHKALIVNVLKRLEGAYAFATIIRDVPDMLIVARKHVPLCIGIGENETFVASDISAFAGRTSNVLFMPDESFAFIRKDQIELYSFSGQAMPLVIEEQSYAAARVSKGSYEHFMLKEIWEQKKIIYDTVAFIKQSGTSLWDNIGFSPDFIAKVKTLHLIGSGSSWHAARIARFFFEQISCLPTRVHLASEFRYGAFFREENDLFIGISQSGETADMLEALRFVHSLNIPTLGLTNVASSTMIRETTGFLLTQAGPEIAVASTKSFTAQLSALFLLAHAIGLEKKSVTVRHFEAATEDLLVAAEVLEGVLEKYKRDIIERYAPFYATFHKFLFLGRHISYPFALEAALKLKEIAYVFVDCHPAGELKHGPLTLVDPSVPVFFFSCLDKIVYQKLLSNVQELKARNGHVVVFAFEGQEELIRLADEAFVIPVVNPLLAPIAMTALMHFFAYQMAYVLGCSIDKPRNLAKVITVE